MRCISSSPIRPSLRNLNQVATLRRACPAGGDAGGDRCTETSLRGRLRAVPEAATDILFVKCLDPYSAFCVNVRGIF